MLFYRASLPLSRQTLNFAAGIIRRHRIPIGSLWRKLNPAPRSITRMERLSMSNGHCLELARLADGRIAVRDSKAPYAAVLRFPPEAWADLLGRIRDF